MNVFRTLAASLLPLLLIAPAAVAQDAQTPDAICAAESPSEPETRTYTESEQVIEAGVDYRAIFCTESGAVYIDLLEDEAPLTVNNFVFLVNSGYYNQTTFHRVIANFMVQGGDPTATGTGGPGYTFEDEINPARVFDRPGLLAMANAGPNTNGSQFFITTVPTPHLNGMHTIFGEVLNGQRNVENIRLRDPQTAAEPGAVLDTIVIVTDPDSVTYEQSKPATEDAEAAFEELTGLIPPDLLAFDSATSGVFTTEEVIDAAPEAGRDLLTSLLETHNHQFRAANTLVNTGCDLENVFFMSIGYTVDVFAATEDAAAAFADPALSEMVAAQNFTDAGPSEALPGALYFTQETSLCDTAAISARAYKQRGPLLITLETTIPRDALPVTPDVVLGEFVALQIYEPLLAEVLYADIR